LFVVLISMLMVVIAACSNGELDEALGQIDDLEASTARLEQANADLESTVADLEAQAANADATAVELQSQVDALGAANADLEATMAGQGQTLILQADIVGEGCMLQNAYVNDGEAKATFRVRVYDPLTGEQLDDEALDSVVVALSDGQEFTLSWGAHPPDTEDDFFWTYGWEIFEGYPAGNVQYTISATASDGRTGQFEPFNVAPSLLTVLDATESA
jgi:multidrug efflux pump subunit AcrA (membrane-fusion protein)